MQLFPLVNLECQQIRECKNWLYKNKLLLFKHQLCYYLQMPASTQTYLVTKLQCQKPTLQVSFARNNPRGKQIRNCVMRPKHIFSKQRKKNSQAIELRLERHKTKITELFLSLILWPGATAKQFEIESLHADYMKSKYTLFREANIIFNAIEFMQ